MKHISIRVPWHDHKWDGSVCQRPGDNPFCRTLPRIAEVKDDEAENKCAGMKWCKLCPNNLPACKGENGAFMSPEGYSREFNHVYAKNRNLPHNALLPTTVYVAPYSFMGVPFRYMSKDNEEEITARCPHFADDEDAPFRTSWVFGARRQLDILNWFSSEISPEGSLAVFYCKNGNPVDEDCHRLIVGMGEVTKVNGIMTYNSRSEVTYPMWELAMEHSIRPNLSESRGFLLPYHEYLALKDEYFIDKLGITKFQAIDQIKLSLDKLGNSQRIFNELSYGCEYVSNHSMLIILNAAYECLRNVKSHGLVVGDWDRQLRWIDEQISKVKSMIGPFPAFAECLRAIGINYAYLIEQDLRREGHCGLKDNPWIAFSKLVKGEIQIHNAVYKSELAHYKATWMSTSEEGKKLLELLSRFEISQEVVEKWYDDDTSYSRILENPYIISEESELNDSRYVTTEMVDLGVIPDSEIQGDWLPEHPSRIDTRIDERRIRSSITFKLKWQLSEGDTLLSITEITDYLEESLKVYDVKLPKNYIANKRNFMEETLAFVDGVSDPEANACDSALQLKGYFEIEKFLRSKFKARAAKSVKNPIKENWESIVKSSINGFDENNPRSVAAVKDQIKALEMFCDKRLSVLTGPAGTGKTTVVKAFLDSSQIRNEGVLLLAPTGKARVRLGQMADGVTAFTIAQFLTKRGFFNWDKMECCLPSNYENKRCSEYKNIIIDECSMLTSKEFFILLNALDLKTVQRIILIGDPYQLPPIGEGRPFADLYNFLNNPKQEANLRLAVTRLETVVRTIKSGDSDVLTLASWFSGSKPAKDSDKIFDKIESGNLSNDLMVYTWTDETQLRTSLNDVLKKELKADDNTLSSALLRRLGLDDIDAAYRKPELVERFQVLTPVIHPMWGAFELNNMFQEWVGNGKAQYSTEMSTEYICYADKVIQLANTTKKSNKGDKKQLSNGQIGFVKFANGKEASVVFSGYPECFFKYNSIKGDRESELELAYAITIHKSQGSDFDTVLVVLPKTGRILSRELIYTALTRAKAKLILFIEDSPSWLREFTKPQYSVLGRRNTNLFEYSVREEKTKIPYVEGLIHKTLKDGLIVRSKSEVIIANMLHQRGIEFEYERTLEENGKRCIPDFTFEDASGDPIILEHLGMLNVPSYAEAWKRKLEFYKSIGYEEGENIFTTRDDDNGSIDSIAIKKVIDEIEDLI